MSKKTGSNPKTQAIDLQKAKNIALEIVKKEKDVSEVEVEIVRKTAPGWDVIGDYKTDIIEGMPYVYRFLVQINELGDIIGEDLNYYESSC